MSVLAGALHKNGRIQDCLVTIEDALAVFGGLIDKKYFSIIPIGIFVVNRFIDLLGEWQKIDTAIKFIRKLNTECRDHLLNETAALKGEWSFLLCTVASMLLSADREKEALPIAEAAVDFGRSLLVENVSGFLSQAALSLQVLAVVYKDIGLNLEAEGAAREAVEMYRSLAEANPEHFQSDLDMVLRLLADTLSILGRESEGLLLIEEARRLEESTS